MIFLHFNKHDNYLTLDGKPISCITLKDTDNVAVCYSTNDINYLPSIFLLNCKNGLPISNDYFYYINWNNSHFDIIINSRLMQSDIKKVSYKSCKHNNDIHQATLFYQANKVYLQLETTRAIITKEIKIRISDFQIKLSASTPCFITIAACANKKKYFAIFKYTDDYEQIFETICDDYSIQKEGILVQDNIKDMLKRTVTRKFSFRSGRYQLENIQFKRSTISYIDKLIPFVFLESVFIKDFDYAINMLAPSLRSISIDKIIPDFLLIENPKYTNLESIALLCKKDNSLDARYFTFEVENSFITEIKEIVPTM